MDLVKVIREVQRKKAERERLNSQSFCRLCAEQTTFVTLQQAIAAHRISLNELPEYVAKGAFHRIRGASGEMLFCQNSLRQFESQLQITQPMRPEFLRSLGIA